jgi:hypothetical protein
VKTKTAPTPDAGRTVRLSCSVILADPARFVRFGEPVRYDSLPEKFRQFIIAEPAEADTDPGPRGAFELNTTYAISSDGKLGRRIQREIAELEAMQAETDYDEEQLKAPPPPEVAAAIDDARAKNVEDVQKLVAIGKLAAAKADLEAETLEAEQAGRNGGEDDATYDPGATPERRSVAEYFEARDAGPAVDNVHAPYVPAGGALDKPAKPAVHARFVRRAGVFVKARKVHPKPGEAVFVKIGTDYKRIGAVGKTGGLPVANVLTKEKNQDEL